MDLDDNKVKVDQIYLRKIVLGTVRGDQFLYMLLEVGYKYSSNCYSVSFSILRSPSLRASLLFYTIFPFYLYHSHVDQIVGVDSCPISTFLKSLGCSCKAEKLLFRYYFLINVARELAARHSIQWQQLFFRYFVAFLYSVPS